MTEFKTRNRYLRLLPGVMLACAALLALNGSGLVHQAFAQGSAPVLQPQPPEANKDFAGGEGETANAAEVDVLTSLSKRRATMDARQADIDIDAKLLSAAETRVDAKIAELKALQTQLAALLAQRDAAQEKQVAALVKTYSAMTPKNAAAIFNSLDDGVLLPVAEEMKSDSLAPVLAAMNPDAARKLTMKLANRLALPEAPQPSQPGQPPLPAAPSAQAQASAAP